MGKMSSKAIKKVAVDIMRYMGVSEEDISNYQHNDVIPQYAYGSRVKGKQWSDEELKKYNVKHKPYAITTDEVCGIKMISFLYVSPYLEDVDFMCDWKGYGPSFNKLFSAYAYCHNVERPYLSESGYIAVEVGDDYMKRIG